MAKTVFYHRVFYSYKNFTYRIKSSSVDDTKANSHIGLDDFERTQLHTLAYYAEYQCEAELFYIDYVNEDQDSTDVEEDEGMNEIVKMVKEEQIDILVIPQWKEKKNQIYLEKFIRPMCDQENIELIIIKMPKYVPSSKILTFGIDNSKYSSAVDKDLSDNEEEEEDDFEHPVSNKKSKTKDLVIDLSEEEPNSPDYSPRSPSSESVKEAFTGYKTQKSNQHHRHDKDLVQERSEKVSSSDEEAPSRKRKHSNKSSKIDKEKMSENPKRQKEERRKAKLQAAEDAKIAKKERKEAELKQKQKVQEERRKIMETVNKKHESNESDQEKKNDSTSKDKVNIPVDAKFMEQFKQVYETMMSQQNKK